MLNLFNPCPMKTRIFTNAEINSYGRQFAHYGCGQCFHHSFLHKSISKRANCLINFKVNELVTSVITSFI